MFTGIVQALCPVVTLERKPGLTHFCIEMPPELVGDLRTGASVAVDGVCLTAVSVEGTRVGFDAMEETLAKTTIGELEVADAVNVERCARMGGEIGGHPMSGHVCAQAQILDVQESENNKVMTFRVPLAWMRFIFSKGFIALDGASLTVVDADPAQGTFKVWFIPETLRLTRFGTKTVGDKVNVEIDPQTQVIVETVERIMKERK